MFQFTTPLTADEHNIIADSKRVIYDGFRQALDEGVPSPRAGILVDEEFGASILRDAIGRGYATALSTEKSGSDESDFEYGARFAEHIESFGLTFVNVLVRYSPEGGAEFNGRQTARLAQLSDYCRTADQRFIFELLVLATPAQMDRADGNTQIFDRRIRPGLMLQTIRALQDAGVDPDIWKIEGLDRREDCLRVVEMARRDGRGHVSCIVLGRGADEHKLARWLETAASVPGFVGFAVRRTTFTLSTTRISARSSRTIPRAANA